MIKGGFLFVLFCSIKFPFIWGKEQMKTVDHRFLACQNSACEFWKQIIFKWFDL